MGCVIKGTFTFILNSSEYIFLADSQPHIYVSLTYGRFIRGKEFTLKDYTSVTLQNHESHIFVYVVTMHSEILLQSQKFGCSFWPTCELLE